MRLMSQRTWLVVGALVVAAAAAGCGGNNPVYPVQGKVMFEGKPMLGGGAISLIPLDKREGKAAGGEIAEDGTFKLTTYRPGDGSMVGEFRVVISQSVEKEPEATPDGQKAPKAAASVPMNARIPIVYADSANSPLKIKVEAKSMNEINLDLKRNVEGAGRPAGGA
jgi:hypothetical protein